MGSAVPVIGLGLQGVSMLTGSGGTQYSPDPKAKYQADLMAIQKAQQNAGQQRQLLQQQTDVANQLADFNREQMYWQLQNERDYYMAELESNYQQGMYQNQVGMAQNEMANMGNLGQSTMGRMTSDAQAQSQLRGLGQQSSMGRMAFNMGETGRGLQTNDARTQYNMAQANNALGMRGMDLQDNNLMNQRAGLGYAEQGIGLQEQQLAQQMGVQNRGLDTASMAANVGEGQAIGQAQLGRQANWNQLLNTFTGNERTANKLRSVLGAGGINYGTQGAQLSNDLNLDPNLAAQQQLANSQFGSQIGGARLQNQMAQAQVTGKRSDLMNAELLERQGFANARGQLGIQGAQLDNQQYANNLQRQGLNLESIGNKSQLDSFINSLALNKNQDYLQNVLIPNLNEEIGGKDIKLAQALQTAGFDINDTLNQMGYSLNKNQLKAEQDSVLSSRTTGEKTLNSDVKRQLAAIEAQKKSTKTNNEMALAAALAQLASGQYGVLSSIGGGLSKGYPDGGGGGGFNLAGISGLLSQAAQAGLFSGGGGSSSGGGYTNKPIRGNSGYQSFTSKSSGVPGGF